MNLPEYIVNGEVIRFVQISKYTWQRHALCPICREWKPAYPGCDTEGRHP